ncbi:MAG TPA: hypothetical protein PKV73_01350 [Agriterribacter sp.]|nr:hypothetical protein [Agriterribacter sp.]
MTQTAAIALALLKGEVISIKTAFNQFGCTNAPREIGRSIERKFDVKVSKTPVKFTSRYGKSGIYYQYRLNRTDYNADGIKKMLDYVQSKSPSNPKTMAEQKAAKTIKQLSLL